MSRLSINRILLGLSGLQLVIIGGIGYGIYRAGRMAEREYQRILAEANALVGANPELINELRSIAPMLNQIQPTVNAVQGDVSTALTLLRQIERRVPPS